MEQMTDYQYAWMMYLMGATGCSLAAWLLFRRTGRALSHLLVITVMVILFTPYAIDAQTMTMAPAVYTLVFGYMEGGVAAIKPVLKLMLGLWGGMLILSLIYQLLTRQRRAAAGVYTGQKRASHGDYSYAQEQDDLDCPANQRRTASTRNLNREERMARDELLREEPIRAVR